MINVIGLGYIGLPTALMMASHGVDVIGTDYNKIMNEVSTLLEDEQAYAKMSKAVNPYGDGKACDRIVRILNGETVDRYAIC